MRVSNNCIEIIKHYESFEENAYICPAGKRTIGYGHVILSHEKLTKVTEDIAVNLLKQDISTAENIVSKYVNVEINQNQFDAMVSLTYNIGGEAFKMSTLLKLLNKQSYRLAADQFDRWNKSNGKVLNGLTLRRMTERDLFNLGELNFYTFE